MRNSWESVVVVIGIILLFYLARRYTPRLKGSKPLIGGIGDKEGTKLLEKKVTKKENKETRNRPAHTTGSAASLVLHPHSFERAKKEYIQNAQHFSGYYEALYLSCAGKLTGIKQEQLLKNWEETIQSIDGPNFTLAWNTIIQKYCGRNFYARGNSKGKGDHQIVNWILQDWYRLLQKWGLHREPRGQVQSELHGGETLGAQNLNYYWLLNGEILEEGQGKAQSLGQ